MCKNVPLKTQIGVLRGIYVFLSGCRFADCTFFALKGNIIADI
jgi:hypothetical protein